VIVTQSARALNDATVDMQLLVKSEKVEYNRNNELLTWSFSNAKVVRNSFDEIKVDKRPGQKFRRIDPVDACIDAHSCVIKNRGEAAVDVQDELERYLAAMGWK
jgi:phage terminase large subunit-like protein